MKINPWLVGAVFAYFSTNITSAMAQTITPGSHNVDRNTVNGLTLNTSIPDKELRKYWEEYLGQFGKVKSKRGVAKIDRAYVKTISAQPVDLVSAVSSSRNNSSIFLAINHNGKFITNNSDSGYFETEQLLKDFLASATAKEEVRLIQNDFSSSEKQLQKLTREKDGLTKDIERLEKDLTTKRTDLEKKTAEIDNLSTVLQTKQKDLEAVKAKNAPVQPPADNR